VELAINPDAAYVAGIKLSSSRISCAVTDMQANVRSSVVVPVQFDKRPLSYVADIIEEAVRGCAAKANLTLDKIFGIGVGVPGLLKSETGVYVWKQLYHTGETTLSDLISKRLAIKTYIENDSNALTLAHLWYGKGAHTNETAILSAAEKSLRSGNWCYEKQDELSLDLPIKLAREGNAPLQSIFAKAGTVIGFGVAALIQIFNPKKIIFSGDGVKSGDLFFGPIKKAIAEYSNEAMSKSVQIIVEKWRNSDWARGAATTALQELYKYPFK